MFSSMRATISGLSMPCAAFGSGDDGGDLLGRPGAAANPASMLMAACAKPCWCGSEDFFPIKLSCDVEEGWCGPYREGFEEGDFLMLPMPAKFRRRSWLLVYALVLLTHAIARNAMKHLLLLKTAIVRILSKYVISCFLLLACLFRNRRCDGSRNTEYLCDGREFSSMEKEFLFCLSTTQTDTLPTLNRPRTAMSLSFCNPASE
mmetsp:Transcript_17828/g.36642  ORF Transcript_17828/g.36642 Transcript_17828/m.36642 type:complete len:204 (-) Transcript_17828:102-713(-)